MHRPTLKRPAGRQIVQLLQLRPESPRPRHGLSPGFHPNRSQITLIHRQSHRTHLTNSS
jgi:hypothetical protein